MEGIRQELRIEQRQTLLLTQEMHQSLQVLQMPLQDLLNWLEDEVALNPFLEKHSSSPYRVVEEIPATLSLYEKLMQQARIELDDSDLTLAEWIIGNLDERGFFTLPLSTDQERVLKKIQQLGPPGIAARSVQECLLLQLEEKKEGLAYKLVKDHLEDLLENRLSRILKKVGVSYEKLRKIVVQEILRLDFSPGLQGESRPVPLKSVDVRIDKVEGVWNISTFQEELPIFSFEEEGLPLEAVSLGNRFLALHYIRSGRKLEEAVQRRSKTLETVVDWLIHKMPDYLEGVEPFPPPVTMKQAAEDLQLHESTIARTVREKWIECPAGILAIRSCFTSSLQDDSGASISNEKAKKLLQTLIEKEDKSLPLSDEALALEMKSRGISCARRTIAKYRQAMRIPSSNKRERRSNVN